MMKNLVTLVTGGASGLGKGTVEYFTKLGAKVVMCDLAASEGHKVAKEMGESVTYVPADVRSEADVKHLISEIEQKHGRLDAVINCAGLCDSHVIHNFVKNKPRINKERQQILMTNLVGTFNVTRLSVGLMARNKPDLNNLRGIVINSAGIEGLRGIISQSSTAAASGGIIAMTKPLAADLNEHGIRVVTIVCGMLESDTFTPRLNVRLDFEKFCLKAPKHLGTVENFAHLAKSCVVNPGINATTIEITAGFAIP